MKDSKNIILPSVIDLKRDTLLGNAYFVGNDQPLSIHKAIETLSYYFQRESNFDSAQYTAHSDSTHNNSEAYIWIEEDWDDTFIVGAIDFRFLGDVGHPQCWSLEWVWIHPYYRNCNLLATAWPHFEKKYGAGFRIEPPVSKAMDAFLRKVNHGR